MGEFADGEWRRAPVLAGGVRIDLHRLSPTDLDFLFITYIFQLLALIVMYLLEPQVSRTGGNGGPGFDELACAGHCLSNHQP
ncbi:hypothetical protein [Novosphingobium sp.]|uniref:hypothetical protein n=1 Tax=Novosphingobium sp. TaxID=1874826 RepID=UPI003BAA51D7